MDRKEFLDKLMPSSLKARKEAKRALDEDTPGLAPLNISSGLAPYAGTWGDAEAIHLLKRLCFGAPREEVEAIKAMTYVQAVDALLNTVNTPAALGTPVKTYSTNTTDTPATDPDWAIPVGGSWVNTNTSSGTVNYYRRESLRAWWFNNLVNQPRSIEEKMMLFWSTHFAIEFDIVDNARYCWGYMNLLRQYATGNFKDFTKAITLNPAMLIYLNGYQNTKTAPDENYARELQELFTLGKGPNSLYTENDVKAAAKVLTGWQVNSGTATSFFTASRHDTTPKVFSAFFNNTTINRPAAADGPLELDDLLAMIFNTNEVAHYICRRIYRFFVYGNISTDVETNVIAPLANTFRTNNYNIKPVLEQLFKSEHFFDVLQFGAVIKSGVDFAVGLVRECKIKLPPASNPALRYRHLTYYVNSFLTPQEQTLGDPPNVSGWAAYHQEPVYDKSWITTDTFPKRQAFINSLINGGISLNGFRMEINVVEFAMRMSNPGDPNALVLDFNKYLLRRTLSQGLRDTIKRDILLTGQITDSYWTDAWNTYVLQPANLNNYTVVNNRLKNLATYLMSKLEEYQLM
jgi:uncharacterized protein (DUF1800 family)